MVDPHTARITASKYNRLYVLLIGCFASNSIGRTLYAAYDGWDKAYFAGDAISWACIGLFLYLFFKWELAINKTIKLLTSFLLIMICNNLLDETLFNPLVFGANEYAMFLIVAGATIRKLYKTHVTKG